MGDIDEGFLQSEKIVEGEQEIGGQLHFYMETHRQVSFFISSEKRVHTFILLNLVETLCDKTRFPGQTEFDFGLVHMCN